MSVPPYQGDDIPRNEIKSVDASRDELSVDSDAARLAEMGYTQEMERGFSKWTLLGVSFALTNSWFGISASLVTGISSGGPIVTVYGIVIIAIINGCVAVSLSELVSAMPNSGGQYFWASELSPKKYANFLAYTTGAIGYAGSLFTCASVALAIGSALMGMIQLNHPNLVIERWMLLPIRFSCVHDHHYHHSACNIFPETKCQIRVCKLCQQYWMGIKRDRLHFPRPERNIPFAIMGTVAIGFFTAFIYSISMFFSMNNLDELVFSSTLVPILELYYQATGSKAGATFLEFMICFTGLGCQIACHTWQARLCWSFARDRGLPGSHLWSQVHPKMGIPFYAHSMSCFVVALLGLLYIGSTTAFNSMVTACIVLLYISYAVPITLLLIKGRNNIKHGPFWLGGFGLAANIVTLIWTLFTLIMYSFPYGKPVTAGSMNYVSAVYAVVFVLVFGYWFLRGHRTFRSKDERVVEAEHLTNHIPQASN
ncbi:uncharacterized protein LAJ45_02452 [Morchella importuna]|uniref:uncharacterized protein n=1 Tax=Morchella importuna TaxID=1174673 RepID=UPI001E8E2EEE|nr:uncharacterized protein LAJ45_02452 [Morchella importuna]KAH8153639.1 hypothetical protein LAJ45_02452 [Morchella importuna]